jgi:hypothetical protein
MGAISLSHVLQTDLEGQKTEASSQQIAVLVHFRFAGSKERKRGMGFPWCSALMMAS